MFGEHAVVYGIKAIAAALQDLRTTVQVQIIPQQQQEIVMSIVAPAIGLEQAVPILKSNILQNDFLACKQEASICYAASQQQASTTSEPNHGAINALTACLYLYNKIVHPQNKNQVALKLHITSTLPVGAGLGSSGSFCVALAAAMLAVANYLEGKPVDTANKQQINEEAFVLEKFFHGTPSGIDNSVSTYGGVLTLAKLAAEPIGIVGKYVERQLNML